jgi:phospholipid transport system substrate-binding protein
MLTIAVRVATAMFLVLTLALAAGAKPTAAADDPAAFVSGVGDDVVAVLKSTEPGSEPRKEKLRAIFAEVFDTQAIAEFVVGRHWQRLTEDEKKRYLDLFPSYVAALYATQFSEYRGQTFAATGTRGGGGSDSFVTGEIRGAAKPIALEFRVGSPQGQMKIRDVKVDGISMLVIKRDEFGSFLTREPPAKLLEQMQKIIDG